MGNDGLSCLADRIGRAADNRGRGPEHRTGTGHGGPGQDDGRDRPDCRTMECRRHGAGDAGKPCCDEADGTERNQLGYDEIDARADPLTRSGIRVVLRIEHGSADSDAERREQDHQGY